MAKGHRQYFELAKLRFETVKRRAPLNSCMDLVNVYFNFVCSENQLKIRGLLLAWPSNNTRAVPLLDHLFWPKCFYDRRQLVVYSSILIVYMRLFGVDDDSLHDDEFSLSKGQGQAGDITILRNNSMNAACQVLTLFPPPPPPPHLAGTSSQSARQSRKLAVFH